MNREPFIGIGKNPEGEDLPLGFGMRLAQEPEAVETFGGLSAEQRKRVIGFIQGSVSGDDAKRRVAEAVTSLKDNNLSLFGL